MHCSELNVADQDQIVARANDFFFLGLFPKIACNLVVRRSPRANHVSNALAANAIFTIKLYARKIAGI